MFKKADKQNKSTMKKERKKRVKKKTLQKPKAKPQEEPNEKSEEKGFIDLHVSKESPWLKVVHWSARILGLLILLFWTVMLVTAHGLSLLTLAEGIVVFALAAVLLCAWRFQLAGGAIFLLIALFYLIISLFRADFMVIIIYVTPFIATGGLFVAEGLIRAK